LEEGKPTGIKRQDVYTRGKVEFGGQLGWVVHYTSDSHSQLTLLEIGFGNLHLRLYGYWSGDEFMEVDRERTD
jgi:hypothetical protein